MAAAAAAARRLLQRSLLPHFFFRHCHKEFSRQFFPSAHIFWVNDRNFQTTIERWIQTHSYSTTTVETAESSSKVDEGAEENESEETCSYNSKPTSDSTTMLDPDNNNRTVKYTALSNLKSSKRHDLAMIYTCKVCETRSVKTLCRESYEKGVVVVRCDGCNNLHLIADRLGWFGEAGSVEDLLAARGEEVKRGSVDSLNLTLEDLAGLRTS